MFEQNIRPVRHVIQSLSFVDTGEYNSMVYRPYTTNASAYSLAKLNEVSEGGQFLSPSILANVTSELIAPKAQHDGVIQVPNGWGCKRMAFNMVVRSETSIQGSSTATYYYLSGFTDNGDYHTNGLTTIYDPKMVMTINNILQLQMDYIPGVGQRPRLVDASRLINGQSNLQFSTNFNGSLHGDVPLRPQDIITKMDTQQTAVDNNRRRVVHSDEIFHGVKTSRLGNDNPAMYLSNTLSAINGSYKNAGEYDTLNTIYSNARNKVLEANIKSDPLFFNMRQFETDLFQTGSFTFGAIQRMQPGIDDIIEHFTAGKATPLDVGINQGGYGYTSEWDGSDAATMASTILVQSMPALMAEYLIQSVSFSVSNSSIIGGTAIQCSRGGNFSFIYHKLIAVGGMDATPLQHKFAQAIVDRIVYDLTVQNQRAIDIHGIFSLCTGENRVKIRVNNNHEYEFVSPAFMNSSYAPVMGKSIQTLDNLACEFNKMADAICTDFSPVSHNSQTAFDGRNPQRFELENPFNIGFNNESGIVTSTKSVL